MPMRVELHDLIISAPRPGHQRRRQQELAQVAGAAACGARKLSAGAARGSDLESNEVETEAPSESECSFDDGQLLQQSCALPRQTLSSESALSPLVPSVVSHALDPLPHDDEVGSFEPPFPPHLWQGTPLPLPPVAPPVLPATCASAMQSPPPAPLVPVDLPQRCAGNESDAAQKLQVSNCDNSVTITWPVDARKLSSKDTVIVSPSFHLLPGRTAPFRIMLQPKQVSSKKGGQSWTRAKGVGSLQLKCESALEESAPVALSVSVGHFGRPTALKHDFAAAGVVHVSPEDKREDWNFHTAVDPEWQSFTIHIDAKPCA